MSLPVLALLHTSGQKGPAEFRCCRGEGREVLVGAGSTHLVDHTHVKLTRMVAAEGSLSMEGHQWTCVSYETDYVFLNCPTRGQA